MTIPEKLYLHSLYGRFAADPAAVRMRRIRENLMLLDSVLAQVERSGASVPDLYQEALHYAVDVLGDVRLLPGDR